MEEYIQEFEALVAQAPNTPEEQLVGYFLAGLQIKIRNQIRPHDPKELMRAMEITLDLEDLKKGAKVYRNNVTTLCYEGGPGVMTQAESFEGMTRQIASGMASNARKESFNTLKEMRSGANMGEGSRHKSSHTLPYPEYVRRREEGMCFQCGGAYVEDEEYVEMGEQGANKLERLIIPERVEEGKC